MTPTNIARLAAWCKMSHETHRHLFKDTCQCGSDIFNVMIAGDSDVAYCDDCGGRWDDLASIKFIGPDPTDPAADAQLVDDVWAARVAYKLRATHWPKVWAHEDQWIAAIGLVGSGICNSMTLALLRAARAAGVPEVVEIMGEEA